MTHSRDEFILQPLVVLAFTDIDDHRQDQEPIARLDRVEADFDRKLGAVFSSSEQITAGGHTSTFRFRGKIAAVVGMHGAQSFGHKHVDRLSDQFFAPITKLTFDLGVDHHDSAVVIDHHHAARAGLHGEPKHFLRKTALDDILLYGRRRTNPVI